MAVVPRDDRIFVDYSFEDWKKLYERDEAAFMRLRETALNYVIENTNPHNKRRLEGLQFQVDQTVQKAKNPLESALRISALMWESFEKLNHSIYFEKYSEHENKQSLAYVTSINKIRHTSKE